MSKNNKCLSLALDIVSLQKSTRPDIEFETFLVVVQGISGHAAVHEGQVQIQDDQMIKSKMPKNFFIGRPTH